MQRILQRFSLGNMVTESHYERSLVEKQKGTAATARLITSIIATLWRPELRLNSQTQTYFCSAQTPTLQHPRFISRHLNIPVFIIHSVRRKTAVELATKTGGDHLFPLLGAVPAGNDITSLSTSSHRPVFENNSTKHNNRIPENLCSQTGKRAAMNHHSPPG